MGKGIKDVAKLAGVSPATVSRTLSGGFVSTVLKQRVLAAIEQTDYRPNLAARRLRANKSDTIGLIIADIRNPFFTAVARTIDDIANQNGQHVILCNTDENPKREKIYLDLMEEENVAGIILAATLPSVKKTDQLSSKRPIMLIDRKPEMPVFDAVFIDNLVAAEKLVYHLYENGRRNIACLYGATSATGFERQTGYERAMRALNLKPNSLPVKHKQETLEKTLETLLAKSGLTDAIIVTNSVLALKTADILQQNGIDVPEQIALAAFDDEPWMQLVFGGITTIAQPIKEIAFNAYRGLMERIHQPVKSVSSLVLSGELIIRGSTEKPISGKNKANASLFKTKNSHNRQ